MIPFEKNYYIQKINFYDKSIAENSIGNYSIKKNVKSNLDGYVYDIAMEESINVIELYEKDKLLMRISPHEIEGSFQNIKWAHGKVGVVGLGLGYFVQEILKKESVKEVIVYEISEEIIDLYKMNFENNEKLTIVKGDALNAEKEKFDCFYVDIYDYKLKDRVVNDYFNFNKIHDIEEYSFFGIEHFMLSCPIDQLIYVYIPENWIDMSKDFFTRLSESERLKDFKKINEEEVLNVLHKFKEVLN